MRPGGIIWRGAAILGALATLSRGTVAQDLRGTVSDSTTRLPIPGAVVVLFGADGSTLARIITNTSGAYRIPASQRAQRLRVVRMGFRPREISVTARPSGPLDVQMVPIPTMLEEVRAVAGASCPGRSDRRAALALLEQARAGLLNSVVARETHPARMTGLVYERAMEKVSDRIGEQNVRIKTGEGLATSFLATRRAKDFVRDGFAAEDGSTLLYFGPDADVLLDETFASGYCFHLRASNRDRPTQVGLVFVPARRRSGRVDIDGTLWIDTAARKLGDLEYRYLGLPVATDAVKPGGRASFWELPNGIVFIDKWHMRLPVPMSDTAYSYENRAIVRVWYSAREVGGELATASWPDGQSYQGPLGILSSRAVDAEGKPVTGIVVRLLDTDYVASPDSLGFFEIPNLLPGPYKAGVVDSAVARYGITLPTPLRFVAIRDSVIQQPMLAPNTWHYVRRPCSISPASYVDDPLLRVRVETPDGKAVSGAHWRLSRHTEVPWQRVIESRTTDADGRARHCTILREGDLVEISAWRDGDTSRVAVHGVGRKKTLTITLPPLPSTAHRY